MLVIVGTGLAGYMLAKEWRKRDTATPLTLVTQGNGAFYSKPLLSTALKAKKLPQQLAVNSAGEMAEQLNATVITQADVTAIDRQNKMITVTGGSLSYDRLVLACGASPIRLALAGDARQDLISVNTIEDYGLFRQWLNGKKHLAILGSGLVGCEFANDLLADGYSLEIISLDDYPLSRFVPAPVGAALKQALSDQGVKWHLSHAAKAVYHHKNAYRIELDNGEVILADGIISAAGLLPDLTLAKRAGLTINRGIVVNQQLKTSDGSIFALGDCAEVNGEVKQYVAPILHCARVLAKVLYEGRGAVNYPAMPVVVKTPCCPVVSLLPAPALAGEWQYAGDDRNVQALFIDNKQQLQGFVLCGDQVKHKQSLLARLRNVHEISSANSAQEESRL